MLDGLVQHIRLDRLRQVPKRPVLDGSGRADDLGHPAHQDDRDVEIDPAYGAHQLEPAATGHVDIADDHVEGSRLELRARGTTTVNLHDREPGAVESPGDGLPVERVVVYEQHARPSGGGARATV